MKRFLVLLCFLVFPPIAWADSFKPVVIYDSDVIMDNSWNEAIHRGILKFEEKTGLDVKTVSVLDLGEFSGRARAYAREGYNPIILTYVDEAKAAETKRIMGEFPSTRFVIFSGVFDVPNAHYFVFSNQEASYLAGYLASRKSQTGFLGFVGGMETPVIKNFLCGFIKGARHENPNTRVLYDFIGHDLTAWSSPDVAYRLASAQIARQADVVFSPSGGSSVGALRAAHDKGVLGIGVDSNQDHLFPGSVLTSVIVRVDTAAFLGLMAARRGIWGDQMKVMGLQENGVGLTFDEYNAALVPPDLRAEIEEVSADIILGNIRVENYGGAKQCVVGDEVLF